MPPRNRIRPAALRCRTTSRTAPHIVAELKQATAPADEAPPAPPTPPAPPPASPRTRLRSGLAWFGLLVVVVGAVFGSNAFSVRDELLGSAVPPPAPVVDSRDAFTAVGDERTAQTKLRSQPWWQDVTTLRGTGPARSSAFTIVASAIQWRLKPSCTSGRIVVRVPGRTEPLVNRTCAQATLTEATGSGPMRVAVQADGPWRLDVEQQIDAPLVEPPRPAMTAAGASRVARGSFYDVDRTGRGTVAVYRQADGRYSIRLDRFFVTPTFDLELRLSTHRAPRTTKDYLSARSKLVSILDVTAGSLNFSVPSGIDPADFDSVVIWCAATNNAYAAAELRTAR